jgi:hypothetical protein
VKMRKPSRRKKAAVSRGSQEPSRPSALAAMKNFHRQALHSLADLAGEIRGPLNSLQTVNRSLLETSLTPEQREFTEKFQAEEIPGGSSYWWTGAGESDKISLKRRFLPHDHI